MNAAVPRESITQHYRLQSLASHREGRNFRRHVNRRKEPSPLWVERYRIMQTDAAFAHMRANAHFGKIALSL